MSLNRNIEDNLAKFFALHQIQRLIFLKRLKVEFLEIDYRDSFEE